MIASAKSLSGKFSVYDLSWYTRFEGDFVNGQQIAWQSVRLQICLEGKPSHLGMYLFVKCLLNTLESVWKIFGARFARRYV